MSKKRKITGNRWIGTVLCFGLFMASVVSGCGKSEGEVKTGEEQSDRAVMGRYVETTHESNGMFTQPISIGKTEDGNLRVFDFGGGEMISDDGGVSWQPGNFALPESLTSDNYVLSVAASGQGEMTVVYVPNEPPAQEEETEDGSLKSEEWERRSTRYCYINTSGSEVDVTFSLEGNDSVNDFWFLGDDRLLATSINGSVFEVNKTDGSTKWILEVPGTVDYLTVTENYLIIARGTSVHLFDKNTYETVSDPVLEEFFLKKPGVEPGIQYSNMNGSYPVYIACESENTIYLFCNSGVFRHTIGGNLMEQLVDGALSSLSDPTAGIVGAVLLDEHAFSVLYTSGNLVEFNYNADIPAIPEVQLNVYGLKKNDMVNQAIAAFRSKNPEVYVKYTIGEEGAVTRDDALKVLNTQIAAGNGPDILLLDNMPIDSYMEKGILMDLTTITKGKKEELLPNLTAAFEKEGAVYALPTQIYIPLMMGPEEEMTKISDLSSLVEGAQRWREQNPEGSVLGAYSAESLIERLIPVCQPGWKNEAGEITEEKLEEFFVRAQILWQVESQGFSDELVAAYEEKIQQYMSTGMSEEEAGDMAQSLSDQAMDYATSKQQWMAGSTKDSLEFSIAASTIKLKERANTQFYSFPGQAENVFQPVSIVGVAAATKHPEMAQSLLEIMISEENLSSVFGVYPNNKKLLESACSAEAMTDVGYGETFGSFGLLKADGTVLTMDIYRPDEEMVKRLLELIEKADTPYIRDEVLESVVTEEGLKVLDGEKSAKEAAESVLQKVSVYMAE